jgi:hypothetical protein
MTVATDDLEEFGLAGTEDVVTVFAQEQMRIAEPVMVISRFVIA